MVFWLGSQLFLLMLQIAGVSNVSALGHLGGAAVGMAAFWARGWVLPGSGGGFPKWRSKGDFSDPASMAKAMRNKGRRG